MVLRMTRPTRRPDSSFLQYRKRVQADIHKAAYGRICIHPVPERRAGGRPVVVHTSLKKEVCFSLCTRDPADRSLRFLRNLRFLRLCGKLLSVEGIGGWPDGPHVIT